MEKHTSLTSPFNVAAVLLFLCALIGTISHNGNSPLGTVGSLSTSKLVFMDSEDSSDKNEVDGTSSAATVDVERRVEDFRIRSDAVQTDHATTKPHLLFLMVDQLRFDAIGTAAPEVVATPGFSRLRREGVTLLHHYTSTPTCSPARAAILTGRSPWRHGMLGYGDIALTYTYAELPRNLREAGYHTVSVGKNHFYNVISGGREARHGFVHQLIYDGIDDEWDDYDKFFNSSCPNCDPLATGRETYGQDLSWTDYKGAPYAYPEELHPTAWVGSRAVQAIHSYALNNGSTTTVPNKQHQQQQQHPAVDDDATVDEMMTMLTPLSPLFLKVSFHRPHAPYDPPARLYKHFQSVASDLPDPVTSDSTGWDSIFSLNYTADPMKAPANMFCGDIGVPAVKQSRAAYFASVVFVDEWVDRILSALEETGMYDETMVLFTADHGDMIGDHFLWQKGLPYESSSHIPSLLRWPPSMEVSHGITANRGSTIKEVTELRDILPTFLDAAGVLDKLRPGESVDGTSLLTLVKTQGNNSVTWREWVDLEHDPGTIGDMCFNHSVNHWNALVSTEWKYVFNAHNATEQLFHLKTDPHERNDLAQKPSMSAALNRWRGRLVSQFVREGRGGEWVQSGVLQKRVKSIQYSPCYPASEKGHSPGKC